MSSNVTQSIPNNTETAVAFDTINYENHWTDSSNPVVLPATVFKPSTPGRYNIGYGVSWASDIVGFRFTFLRKNGDDNLRYAIQTTVPDPVLGQPQMSSDVTLSLNGTTDYVELLVYQNSGGAVDIGAAGTSDATNRISLDYIGDQCFN
jgi:hypothetical protein